MMIAVPEAGRTGCSLEGCSGGPGGPELLEDLAVRVPIERCSDPRRGPEEAAEDQGESGGVEFITVATKKLLDASQGGVPPPAGYRETNRR